MKRWQIGLLALAVLTLGCHARPGHKHAGTPERPWLIGMSQCNLGEPWRVQMNEDIEEGRRKAPEPEGRVQGRAERLPQAARAGRGAGGQKASTS